MVDVPGRTVKCGDISVPLPQPPWTNDALRIFLDASVIETFIVGREAITSRVYNVVPGKTELQIELQKGENIEVKHWQLAGDLIRSSHHLNASRPRPLSYSCAEELSSPSKGSAMTLDRRGFLSACSRAGITSALFPGVLYTLTAQAQEASGTDQSKPPKITPEMIDAAAVLAGIGPFTARAEEDDDRRAGRSERIVQGDPEAQDSQFCRAGICVSAAASGCGRSTSCRKWKAHEWQPNLKRQQHLRTSSDLAFASVSELASLLHARKITSLALTQMYIDRLKRYDSKLHFVISLTEERALAQAKAADAEIAERQISRPTARHSLGRERPARC